MAFPTYQAQGSVVSSITADVSPAWPAHAAGDIGLLVAETGGLYPELSVPAGFVRLPSSPQKGGDQTTASNAALAVWWCRATSAAMGNPTVGFVRNRIQAVILTFRGCSGTGVPFTSSKGYSDHVADAGCLFPGLTTTQADSLVVGVLANSGFVTVSGYTNANLANMTERLDSSLSIGDGSGLVVFTGEDATAGAVADTTATFSGGTSKFASLTLALTAVAQPADNYPRIELVGTMVEAITGTISPAWPEHVAGDLGILVVESGVAALTFVNAQGFTELNASPQDASSGTAGTKLSVFWKRAASGAEPAPQINFNTDHIKALIFIIRNAPGSGTPIDASAGGVTGVSTTALSFPAIITTAAAELVVQIVTNSRDEDYEDNYYTSQFSNAALDNIVVRYSKGTIIGSGSGIGILGSRKVTAGNTGNTVANSAGASYQAMISFSILPNVVELTLPAAGGTFVLTGQSVGLLRSRLLTGDVGTFVLNGQIVTFAIIINYLLQVEAGEFTYAGFPINFRKTFGSWSRREPVLQSTWVKKLPLEN